MCSQCNRGYDIAVGVLGYEISGEPVGAGGSRWDSVRTEKTGGSVLFEPQRMCIGEKGRELLLSSVCTSPSLGESSAHSGIPSFTPLRQDPASCLPQGHARKQKVGPDLYT